MKLDDKSWLDTFNGIKNIVYLLCILCAYVFAFISPIKSIAFTLLGALLGISNWTIHK